MDTWKCYYIIVEPYYMDREDILREATSRTKLEHGGINETFLKLMNCSSQGGYVMMFYDKGSKQSHRNI